MLAERQEGHPACKKTLSVGMLAVICWSYTDAHVSGYHCRRHNYLLLRKNSEWFDILVLAYPGCPGILVVKQNINKFYSTTALRPPM